MSQENKIDYLEIPCTNLEASKTFFSTLFGWEFEMFGEEYAAFNNAGMPGGFYQASTSFKLSDGVPLVVIYRADLEKAMEDVTAAGGTVTHPVFEFPGGARFHFTDPSGNEFAMWSDQK